MKDLKKYRVEAWVYFGEEGSKQINFYLMTKELSLNYVDNLVRNRIQAPLKDVTNIDIVIEELEQGEYV